MSKKEIIAALVYVDVPSLEAKGNLEVWVVNNHKPRCNLLVSIPKAAGGYDLITVLNTWIPQNLTAQTTKRLILNAPEFRKQVAKRNLKIVDAKSARLAMTTPEAAKEETKLLNVDRVDQKLYAEQEEATNQAIMSENGGDCRPWVLELLGRELSKELKEPEMLGVLQDREDEMQEADFKYLSAKSGFSKIKKWCSKQVKTIAAADEED